MSKFKVVASVTYAEVFYVEANTAEEAEELVLDGEVEVEDETDIIDFLIVDTQTVN